MEAAKKADMEFELHPRSTQHKTRDAADDIKEVSVHPMENGVTLPKTGHTSPPFRDVTEDGFSKVSQTWLDHVLRPAPIIKSSIDSELQTLQESTIDLDYELHHVL